MFCDFSELARTLDITVFAHFYYYSLFFFIFFCYLDSGLGIYYDRDYHFAWPLLNNVYKLDMMVFTGGRL